MVTNKEIIAYLKTFAPEGNFIDGLKIKFRPLVCPFQELFALVNAGDRIADVGCGSGQLSLLLRHYTKPSSVYGIEISERLVANANALCKQQDSQVSFHFETYDGSRFPDEIKTCNLVFLVDVLHHVPKAMQVPFIKNLYAIMAPGARLVLKDIDGSSPLVLFNKMHDIVFAGEIGKEMGWKTAGEVCTGAGFVIISNFRRRTAVYPHYFLILEKPVK